MNDNGQMNSDFRVDTEFLGAPKTLKLQRRLGAEGIIALLNLWAFAAKKRCDGDLSGNDAESIEILARWDGEPGKLVATLIDLRWLDGDEESGFRLHDWAEHQPYCVKAPERQMHSQLGSHTRHHLNKGKLDPESCKLCRQALEEGDDAGSNAGSNAPGSAESNAGANAPIPEPSTKSFKKRNSLPRARARETGFEKPPPEPPVSPRKYAYMADQVLKLRKRSGIEALELYDPATYAAEFEEATGVTPEFFARCRDYYGSGDSSP